MECHTEEPNNRHVRTTSVALLPLGPLLHGRYVKFLPASDVTFCCQCIQIIKVQFQLRVSVNAPVTGKECQVIGDHVTHHCQRQSTYIYLYTCFNRVQFNTAGLNGALHIHIYIYNNYSSKWR